MAVEHRQLVNYATRIAGELALTGDDRVALVQPLTVDAALTCLFPRYSSAPASI